MPFAKDLSKSKDILDCIIIAAEDFHSATLESLIDQHQELKLLGSHIHTEGTWRQTNSDEKANVLFFDFDLLAQEDSGTLSRLQAYADFLVLLIHPSFVLTKRLEEHFDHFLTKPFTYREFQWVVGKLLNSLMRRTKLSNGDFIFVKGAHRFNFDLVEVDHIIYVEADKNDIIIHTESEKFKVRFTLSDLEHQLDKGRFIRVSRSYLVAIGKVKKIRGNQLVLKNEITLLLSGKFKLDFHDRIEKLVLRKSET